ncbi:MAG: cysteine desulfurase [Alicyclobacillus herbarius]|uniref:cysteine desulfurase family protein n=1 Tax=Alicyclobacillus herbarius TaxID=122960 RepID=UPI002356A395|nr:cysteine desulfurase family protein [Alicyclobacillus herbarius]MCL6631040.1 cysteine desulfurase [Alicyclobacillus herbarius]
MIYLDHAATTAPYPEVVEAMQACLSGPPGNPSSLHQYGRRMRAAIDEARLDLARLIGCKARDLVFTGGGTEAVQAALVGAFLAAGGKGHVVVSAVEHHAVLHTCDLLEALGARVTQVDVDEAGRVDVSRLLCAIEADTCVVSLMAVNNELGTIQPVREATAAIKAKHPEVVVHSDMIQALGIIDLGPDVMGVDLASFSAHKVHGPQGVGLLYIRQGTRWTPVLRGGAQERNRRAGTENVPAIVGFGAAARRLLQTGPERREHIRAVRDRFCRGLAQIPGVSMNTPTDASPAIVNVSFAGVRNETLLMRLDLEGVAASAGAACSAGSLEPSHVLSACGLPEDRVRSAVRFSFSEDTQETDIERALQILASVLADLRRDT